MVKMDNAPLPIGRARPILLCLSSGEFKRQMKEN